MDRPTVSVTHDSPDTAKALFDPPTVTHLAILSLASSPASTGDLCGTRSRTEEARVFPSASESLITESERREETRKGGEDTGRGQRGGR